MNNYNIRPSFANIIKAYTTKLRLMPARDLFDTRCTVVKVEKTARTFTTLNVCVRGVLGFKNVGSMIVRTV